MALTSGGVAGILLPATDATLTGAPGPATRHSLDCGSATVLLAEDEVALRQVAERILHRGGYHVLSAADAAEALDIVDRHPGPIDALVTDVIMPGMLGTALADTVLTTWEVAAQAGDTFHEPVLRSGGMSAERRRRDGKSPRRRRRTRIDQCMSVRCPGWCDRHPRPLGGGSRSPLC
ncbi:response regulator [Dactylosporangium sp. NPDC050688]|uniref:response regulator n=1 Tax=Dactylosporangium sp. NPDC050688 TaxID=3157217 RepID=UPI0033CB6638